MLDERTDSGDGDFVGGIFFGEGEIGGFSFDNLFFARERELLSVFFY